jgi:hypothetical protein
MITGESPYGVFAQAQVSQSPSSSHKINSKVFHGRRVCHMQCQAITLFLWLNSSRMTNVSQQVYHQCRRVRSFAQEHNNYMFYEETRHCFTPKSLMSCPGVPCITKRHIPHHPHTLPQHKPCQLEAGSLREARHCQLP